MSLTELVRTAREAPKRVYIVVGGARPLVEEAVMALLGATEDRIGLAAFNHTAYRATEPGASEAFSAARTLPMMADLRRVIIRDIEEGSDEFYTSLLAYLEVASPSTVVVLTGAGLPKQQKGRPAWARKIKAALRDEAMLVIFDPKSVRPEEFVRDRASALGKQLGRREATLLVQTVGTDLALLASEVEKAATYVGEAKVIDSESISQACSLLAEAVVWDLTSGLATGNRAMALEALHRLGMDGDDPRRLLAMIAWQYRELLKAADLARSGLDDGAIRKRIKGLRWDVWKKVRPQLHRFERPEAVFKRLARANRDMNSHRGGADRVLDGLVLSLLPA